MNEKLLKDLSDSDLLKILMDNSEDTIYFKDLDSKFILINKAQTKVLNLNSPEEAIGKTDFDFFNKEHAEMAFQDEQKIIKTGQPIIGKLEYFRKPDGNFAWYSATKVPIKNSNGEIIGILGISRDISEKKNVIELLKNSEEHFRVVWEKSIDGFRIMDENGIIELVNESFCKLVKKSMDELIGKPFTVIYQDAYSDEMIKKQKERLKTKTIEEHFERELTLWNGEKVIFELSNCILETPGSKPKIFSIFRDITKRVIAEEKLKKMNDELEARIKQRTIELDYLNARLKEELAQKARVEDELKLYLRELEMNKILLEQDERELKMMNEKLIESEIKLRKSNANKYLFLSLVSDELREPFERILNSFSTIQKDIETNNVENLKTFISNVHNSIKNLNEFLGNVLYWLQIQTGRIDYKPIMIELQKAVNHFLLDFKKQASYKNITINNLIAEDVYVFADVELLEIIIKHLLSNAIKFSHKDSEIKIYSSRKDEYEEIVIEDFGIGMSEETLKSLFRIDVKPTLKEAASEKGSAMGLIVCKELIDKHGGKISVESELNKGTKVKFTIKRYEYV